MKLDLLKKLTRLANNNPNDNEANLAARKVAKMLQENNWFISDNGTSPKNEPSIRTNIDPRTRELHIVISDLDQVSNPRIRELLKALQYEVNRPRTWNDVHRSEEPFWSSKPPSPNGPSQYDYDAFYRDWAKRYEEWFKKQWQGSWEPEYHWGANPNVKQEKPKTERKCSECGNLTQTSRTEEPYVCGGCKWKNYWKKL